MYDLCTEMVDINSKGGICGRTPLSYAAENGHKAVVATLLRTEEVQVDSSDIYWPGPTAALSLLQNLKSREEDAGDSRDTRLAQAALSPVAAVLLRLREAHVDQLGTSWPALGTQNRTPLSYAAMNGHIDVVAMLLDTTKADVDAKDASGRTPLSYAAAYGHKAVVAMLLDTAKTDVDAKDATSRTPLSYAAQNGHDAVVAMLLCTNKVDVDSQDEKGRTPLSYAAENSHVLGADEVDKFLMKMVFDIDSDDTGWRRAEKRHTYARGKGGLGKVFGGSQLPPPKPSDAAAT